MKIWVQSAGAFGRDPAWAPYEQGLSRRLNEVVRPGTVVELHGTDATIPGLAKYRAPTILTQQQAIRNAMRAEEQGYDAFVCTSTNDGGAAETRELVTIPVVFITEACLHLACLLSDKFAFFTNNRSVLDRLTEVAERYGLKDRMVPGGCMELTGYAQIMDMYKNPKSYIEPALKAIKEIGARGANLLFPAAGALNIWLVENKLMEVDGITILDASAASVKIAEHLVDLRAIGVKRSARYYPQPQGDILQGLKKAYGV